MPHVVVFSLGGTIAMSGPSSDHSGGVVPELRGEDLIAGVPGLEQLASITAKDFRRVPGASLRVRDLVELAGEISGAFTEGADGVVVTQGTDTIEESAYCLDLLLDERRPVVVTGAMRNPTLPGADGPANLFAATVVAASGVDLSGVVVVLGDEVHSARAVAKTHSMLPSAFASPGGGPVALVVEGRLVRRYQEIAARRRVRVDLSSESPSRPWVPIVTVGLDEDARSLESVGDADAVVLEALGAGHVPRWLVEPISKLAGRMPVVMTTRTRRGPVLRETYGFDGSERDLRSRGVAGAGPLDAIKARILLMLMLRSGATREEILDEFDELDHEGWVQPAGFEP